MIRRLLERLYGRIKCNHPEYKRTYYGYECVDCDAVTPACIDCGDIAECGVPHGPGMGNEPYCEDDCPRCNP